ncbi:hypothetical protein Purlil1_9587 [Purpureocillium lilacinum]|uniref:Sulfatase N-terminal domain-containing protein n=1 Tax=Purpureocillium lilacinum TaxID=33203 RepID=A0ABR0BRF0_PURLI|nr:hypothetical protein Purlil1_9587 [Purpureocillium lilacinum]
MNSMAFMPNVRNKIATSGVRFQRHYCTSAFCCPSRVSLLTGKCVHNTNVTEVSPPHGAYDKFVRQGLNNDYLPLWLQDAGISIYYVGKLMNGLTIDNYRSPPPRGWTGSHFLLDPGAYDYLNSTWTLDNHDWVSHSGVNAIDATTKHSVDMLHRAIDDGKPFFMVVAPTTPHIGINASNNRHSYHPIPPARWKDAFADRFVPRTPNWNSKNHQSGASWLRNLPRLNDSAVADLDELYRARARCIAGVDDMVDHLLSVLEEAGITNKTHIVFTTDNGYHMGQHRLGPGKKQGFETDIHIPLVWRGPGVPEGRLIDAVSTHTDMAPTFLALFGLPLRTNLDGRVIPAVVPGANPQSKPSEHLNVELWGGGHPYELGPYASLNSEIPGVANNTYKALRIVGGKYSLYYSVWCTNEHELYDMVADEHQTTNLLPHTFDILDASNMNATSRRSLFGRPLYPVVQRLDALLMVLKACVGEQCTYPWRQLHPLGDIETLEQAMDSGFDLFYEAQPKVSFAACEAAYLPEVEGPQEVIQYRPEKLARWRECLALVS